MTGEELLEITDDLETYLEGYDSFLGRRENREHFRRFARGQLGPIERKSLEPIADAEGVPPRTLQFFFSRYAWDEGGVRDELQRKVAASHGDEDGIFVVDETSDAKKGEWTAGVSRQYCGETGKIDNCIVTVHLAYAHREFHALLDGELFLPECWNPDPQDELATEKRRKAGIPDDVVHESKPAMALRQLRRARENGVPGRWASADEAYGGKPWWRREVDAMRLWYVAEVPRNTHGWTRRPGMRIPAYSGRGRRFTKARPSTKAGPVEALAREALRCRPWKRFRVHDTEKGPEVWEFRTTSFFEQSDRAPKKQQRLLVARNVRTGEVKYFLSNAPAGAPLGALVRVAFSRWRIERCFQDAKSELGLGHAEVRNHRAIHRHLILTAVNHFFLQDWMLKRRRGRGKGGSPSARWPTRCRTSSRVRSKAS
jgi:SRSO17 transposase